MASQKLLLIEDDLSMGELLVSVLARSGHAVTWFVRVRLVSEGRDLMVMDADGNEQALDASAYELALVDWRLKGSALDGPAVTAHLVSASLPVVGVSGLSQLNDETVRAGARGGIAKDELVSKLLSGELVIDRDFAGC